MLRQKFFTAISIFGISFTIMVFSIIASITAITFGNDAPNINRERTLYYRGFTVEGDQFRFSAPEPVFYDQVEKLANVETMGRYIAGQLTSFKNGKKTSIDVVFTDEKVWKIYKHDLLEGRTFTADEARGAQSIVVITESVKKHYFGDEKAVGQFLETTPRLRVIGVIKDFLHIGGVGPEAAQAFIPLNRYHFGANKNPIYSAIIVAKQQSDLPEIKQSLSKLINERYNPKKRNVELWANDVYERNDFGDYLAIMAVFIFFTMVIPALNLVGINIGRIAERRSEIGIRKAFGASSSVLAGQFIAESIIITLIGGLLGVLLTYACSGLVITHIVASNDDVIASNSVLIHWDVIMYAVLASLFFGLLSGAVPAWRMSRLHAVKALKNGNL